MTSLLLKDYHDTEHDGRALMQTYIGVDKPDSKAEFLERPMQFLYKILSSGLVKGKTLMDVSLGPIIATHMIAADFFEDIFLFDSSDASLQEMTRWVNNEAGAMDWLHSASIACELKNDRVQWQEQEAKVRKAIKQIIKIDFTKDKILGNVTLPPADCLISVFYLEVVSKDCDNYLRNLKKLSTLLKVGAHLILGFNTNMTYYTIGQHKFFVLKQSEQRVRKALQDNGYSIKLWEKYESRLNTHLLDHEHFVYVVACKEKEV